ncbi:hypothetical protein ACH9L7_16780 (plasmid) [Haloferax sp. S1W]|uniref:hypothetical protein n=1 Tax=Haloferax sp. S1W TaxID=3377110 RepID=UPI0037C6E5D4
MALPTITWISMAIAIAALPGVASIALVKSLRSEERKLNLLKKQDAVDSYSPRTLAELREWIQANPNDTYAPVARQRYNECVETLREVDEPYYDWSPEEIDQLDRLD